MAARILYQQTISAVALQGMTVGATQFNWLNRDGSLGPATSQPTLSRVVIPPTAPIFLTAGFAQVQISIQDGGQTGIVAGQLLLAALLPNIPPSPAGQLSYGSWTLAAIGTGANLFLITLSQNSPPALIANGVQAGATALPVPTAFALALNCTTAPSTGSPLTIAVIGITPGDPSV